MNAIPSDLRRKYFNRCDPDEPLDPLDERNVDIDEQIPEARGISIVGLLAEEIESSDRPRCEFFTGLRGSGKSTELRRLVDRLSAPAGANLLPIVIDTEEKLGKSNPIDVADILTIIVYHTEHSLLVAEGMSPEQADSATLREGLFTRLWRWLTHTEVELKKVELSGDAKAQASDLGEVGAGLKVELELRANPSLRQRLRDRVSAHLSTFLAEIRGLLLTFEARAKRLGRRGLLIVVDSLEKLRGTSHTWTAVLDSAERVFDSQAEHLQLPVHVIYTFPPALALRLRLHYHFLPMLKLVDRAGQRAGGFEAAWLIVLRRVPEDVLKVYFGEAWVARINRLITWSGGYPRELVYLLGKLLASAREISEDRFEQQIALIADEYRSTVPDSAFRKLAQIHLEKRIVVADDDDKDRRLVDLLLGNNIVLRYQNRDPWADVHPAVLEMPQVQDAVAALRRERDKTSAT